MDHPGRALDPATIAVTSGRPPRTPDGPLNTPIVRASTYHAGGPVGYGRTGNPSWSAFEEALGALEGGTAVAYASGTAAACAALALVPRGATIVAPVHAYLGSQAILNAGVADGSYAEVRRIPTGDTHAMARACEGADLVWVETPANPTLDIADLDAIVAAAHAAHALVVVDATFATPLVLRALDKGADVVVHSATKFLSGHADLLLGAAVAIESTLVDSLLTFRSLRGAVPSPSDTWLALRGLRTLALRVERAQHNAGILAARLHQHPAVSRVRYPGLASHPGHDLAAAQLRGFGAIVSVELAGGRAAADRLCAAVRVWVHTTSLGGVESTLERRRRWPDESVEVPESLVRLSVGIEAVEDLWDDLAQALD